ncbi:MAG TPA: LuxR C-terminal-related transcriptional regulator [Anaerolinea sp.]|nr:LuxR C-terminal-related transcriptional regulator [Anaerolinea sp.]
MKLHLMDDSDLLLQSKLHAPPPRPGAVPRPRLVERIEQGLRGGVVLVSAPAGFGKSSLLAQWAAGRKTPPAWLSLDENDNDPARFFTYLAAAIQAATGRPTGRLDKLLAARQALPVQILANALLGDLEQAGGGPVIVLDDLHVLHETGIHQGLAYLIERLPAGASIILSTRADPPVPLARLRSLGRLEELRAADLRFNPEESRQLLDQALGLRLNPEQMAALDSRTEGWAAGLQMAGLSMRGRSDLDAFLRDFSGSHRFILDYLVEEVLKKQPPEVQAFLLETSLLERLCGDACDALLDSTGSQALLEQIERDNLFLIPLDQERRWYRYHPLFADLLRARLQRTAPDRIPWLHKQAGTWFESHGFLAEAVEHALQAGDDLFTAGLVERYAQERWALSDRDFLNLMRRLPDGLIENRPAPGIYKAWMLIIAGQVDAAEALLIALATRIDPDSAAQRPIAGFVRLLRLYAAALRGLPGGEPLPDPRILDQIPPDRLSMRNSADVVYAMLSLYRSDLETARAILRETIRRDEAAGGTTALSVAGSFLARLSLLQGRLSEAAATCRESIQSMTARGLELFYLPGNCYLTLGDALRERGDLDQAETQIREGMRLNLPWDIPSAHAAGYTALARVRIARGDLAGAAESLEQAERYTTGRRIPPDSAWEIRALRAACLARLDRPEQAQASLETTSGATLPAYIEQIILPARARIFLARNDTQAALATLTSLEQLSAAAGYTGRRVAALALTAAVQWGAGATTGALDTLARSLELAQVEGHRSAFLDAGEPMRELIRVYLRRPDAGHKDFAKSIADLLEGDDRPAPSQAGLVEALTPRELEVLERIAAGDSNQAIAARLVITLSAVKKHAGSIYGKLGVNSRTQAVRRAREFGLLPAE